jgi:hypothetical protein
VGALLDFARDPADRDSEMHPQAAATCQPYKAVMIKKFIEPALAMK